MKRHVVILCVFGLLAILAVSLMGCATRPEPKVIYRDVKVEVPVTCVPADTMPPPEGLETKESLKSEPDEAIRLTRMAADWAIRVARMEVTEPVVAGCRR